MTPLYQNKKQDSKPENNHLQILFVGGNHWIVASTVQDRNTVAVYDSLHNTVNDSTKDVISNLFFPPNNQVMKNTEQAGVRDCGLFAIANAVAIANGVSPSAIKFDQTLMRIHLMQCFKDKNITLLPCEIISSYQLYLIGKTLALIIDVTRYTIITQVLLIIIMA